MQAASRDLGPQYALPFVIRVERAAPPARTDALEAAARAVLLFLSDPRVTGARGDGEGADGEGTDGEPAAGEWTDIVRAWQDARIRKVVRRARGTAWRRALGLPGITVAQRSAEVRVFPPVPVDDWPEDLAKLQVSGTDFTDPETPAEPAPGVPVLWLNPGLPMTAGKAMAQAGHGAQLAWWALEPRNRSAWRDLDFDLRVRMAAKEQWDELLDSGLPVVTDGGFTEVAPGSATVVADHPALRRATRRDGA
jgi:peptidyl-tRNA hydrolase